MLEFGIVLNVHSGRSSPPPFQRCNTGRWKFRTQYFVFAANLYSWRRI